ncbi:MAG: hypothetical protein M3N46_08650 [Actinomycetota bacterium]|nr:hypothetical protein [Actinomycetota bacterium]
MLNNSFGRKPSLISIFHPLIIVIMSELRGHLRIGRELAGADGLPCATAIWRSMIGASQKRNVFVERALVIDNACDQQRQLGLTK